ncbi:MULTISPECIES: hypothetical protein [unclassified Pseudoalteromonas]|uniref:hypothetical protein n=1 Tax=unclassified Pseudoalteromonas TaxID=194690 RepID=UPI0014079123|nr:MULTISPECIES: hypothetical protein [unclassified Pseudoalteromonas]MBH0028448.1 hypothetical protein [Pseudoalteromonas sp. SWN29]MBH0039293.1 hypothetical protein [Pseudoalteromonas sp. SWN166]MBH0041165.1 hypothetical protein [Pseudoalteromonas sp. SWXJZ10B]
MKFYIVKKDHQLEAIPAKKALLERYQANHYSYVNVVSGCNKQDALKRLSTEQKHSKKWLLIGANIAVFSVILTICTIN